MNTQSRKSIRLLTQEIDMKKTALKKDCFKFGAQKTHLRISFNGALSADISLYISIYQ